MGARLVPLNEVCRKRSSNLRLKDVINGKEGPYPVYGASGIVGYSRSYQIDQEYVAVVKDGAGVGRVLKCEANSSVLGTLQPIVPADSVNRDYLFSVLETLDLAKYTSGSTIPHIYFKDYRKELIPYLDRAGQNLLAGRFRTINRALGACNSLIERFDLLVKSRFTEMFGDLSVNDKNWQMTKLSEICDVRDGTHASPKYCKTGYPLMTSKNFSQGFADFSSARLISQDDFEVIDRRSRVDTGDIVMPMIGTIGHPVIIRSNRKFAIKNVALFKMESSQINAACLKALLESDYFSRAVKSSNRGATQKFISLGSIRALPVPIIPEHIQGAFAELVAQVDKLRFDALSPKGLLCSPFTKKCGNR